MRKSICTQERKWPSAELATNSPPRPPTREELIDKAIELNTQRHQSLWDKGKVAAYDQHDIAYFFAVLHQELVDNDLVDSEDHKSVPLDAGTEKEEEKVISLYESIQNTARAVRSAKQPFEREQLDRVLDHMVDMMAETCFRVLPSATRELLQKDFTAKFPEGNFTAKWAITVACKRDGTKVHDPASGVVRIVYPKVYDPERLQKIWSVYQDIMLSPHVYGVNLQHLERVEVLLNQIVKRDRLPSANSLPAQHLLRSAWNMADTCVYNADRYKTWTKIGQFVTLFLSTTIVALASFRQELSELSPQFAKNGIFFIAALLTVITGMLAYLGPDNRWRELRATAEHVESEVFQFRTRTGAYSTNVSAPNATELIFRKKLEDLTTTAAQGASLGSSSFYQRYHNRIYRHGQNKDSNSGAKMLRFDYESVDVEAPVHIEKCTDSPDNRTLLPACDCCARCTTCQLCAVYTVLPSFAQCVDECAMVSLIFFFLISHIYMHRTA